MEVPISNIEKISLLKDINIDTLFSYLSAYSKNPQEFINKYLEDFKNHEKTKKFCKKLTKICTSSSFPLDLLISCFVFMGDKISELCRLDPFDDSNIESMNILVLTVMTLENDHISLFYLNRYEKLNPFNSQIHKLLGKLYEKFKNYENAFYHYSLSLKLENNMEIFDLICTLLMKYGKNEMLESYSRKAYELYPHIHNFFNYNGVSLVNLKKYKEAIVIFEKGLSLKANSDSEIGNLYSNLSICYDRLYDYTRSVEYIDKSLKYNPNVATTRQSKLMMMLFDKVSYKDRLSIVKEHKEVAKLVKKTRSYEFPESFCNNSKVNIGFVSGDFIGAHPVYLFLKAFFNNYNKNIFNVTCYSTKEFDITGLNIKDISRLSSEDASDLIYEDKNMILIDLSGQTSGTRMDVFKNKPAPVQITYCGYPATTGLSEIDYRISDRFCEVDENISQEYHAEKLLLMKNCFLCYIPDFVPDIVENIPEDFLILGCYNRVNKITDFMTKLIICILERIPKVKIAFNSQAHRDETLRNKFVERFPKELRHKIMFIHSTGKTIPEHLQTFNQVNIHLDTNPYSGTTTTCESLTMGVPSITIYDTVTCYHVTNVTSSILKNSDLDYFVCDSVDDLLSKLQELSQKPKEYWQNFKQDVRTKFLTGRATNKDLYVKNFTELLLSTINKKTPEQYFIDYINRFTNSVPQCSNNTDLICVIIEPRRHPNLKSVIRNVSHFASKYPIVWLHSEENRDFLDEDDFSNVTRIKISDENLNLAQYNAIMTSPHFWGIFNCKRILIFQTDSCLLREGIDEFLKYDLIGAPWPDGWTTQIIPENLICGNGGLTIRNPKLMREICLTSDKPKVPEDYFFSSSVYELAKTDSSIVLPQTREEASMFCSELTINSKCLGVHAVYKFNGSSEMEQLFS